MYIARHEVLIGIEAPSLLWVYWTFTICPTWCLAVGYKGEQMILEENAPLLCLLYLLLPSLYTSKFYIVLNAQLRCQSLHETSMLPLQEMTSCTSEYPTLFTWTSLIISTNWLMTSQALCWDLRMHYSMRWELFSKFINLEIKDQRLQEIA